MTYSLAGRCARTGMVGAIVTTSSLAVGSRCPFAAAGVGAVLTQHRTDPRLGPLALDLLRQGFGAKAVMDAIVAATPHRHWRQLAIIDSRGESAAYSGANVRKEQGQAQGRDCVAIANIVRTSEVPAAMVRAFEQQPQVHLAVRLIEALKAGDDAGGEFQPVTSAALLIAYREAFAYVDLRVDDHPKPIDELARLWAAYEPEADPYVVRAVDPENATRPPGMTSPDKA